MRNAKELIGLTVVVADRGEEIERIEGTVLDRSETRVSALLVDSDDWSRHARVIPLNDVRLFSKTSVAVSSEGAVHDVVQIPELRRVLDHDALPIGTKVVSEDGVEVGTVNDVRFNEDTGGIDSFLFSRRTAESRAFGRFMLPVFDELDEEVIVHASNVKQNESSGPAFKSDSCVDLKIQPGRIPPHQGQHTETSDKAGDSIMRKGWVRDLTVKQHLFGRFWKALKSNILAFFKRGPKSVNSYRIQRALGNRARHSIADSEDRIVVQQDEEITIETIVRARKAGVLDELLSGVELISLQERHKDQGDIHHGRMDEWSPPFI